MQQQPMSTVLALSADVEDGQSAPVSEGDEDAAGRGNDDRPQVTAPARLCCCVLPLASQCTRHVMGSLMQRPD